MNTEKYDKRTLTDYLLGSSVESDIETFDELSIADDEFADELRSVENDLIDAYLHDELGKSDLERFQATYLASPLRREKVEFARSLQIAAEKESTLTTSNVYQKESSENGFRVWNIFSGLQFGSRLGLAALLVMFVGVFVWALFNLNPMPVEEVRVETTRSPSEAIQTNQTPLPDDVKPQSTVITANTSAEKTPDAASSPKVSPTPKPTVDSMKPRVPETPKLATFVLRLPTRGTGNLQMIPIPAGAKDVAFTLPLETDEFKSFRVSLTHQSGKVLWQSGKLSPGRASLSVRLPASLLAANIYSFSVIGIDEENRPQNIGNYSFQTVLK